MFDPKPSKLITQCELAGIFFAVDYQRSRRRLFLAGTDRAVYQVDAAAEKPVATKRWENHESYVSTLVALDDVVITGGFDNRLIWTDAGSGKQIRVIDDAHDGWIRDMVVVDENRLGTVGDDMAVKIWNLESGKPLSVWQGHEKKTPQGFATALYTIAVSPDGKTIATADRIGHVLLWNVADGRMIRRLEAAAFYTYDAVKRSRSLGGIRSVCFSPDGSKLAISGIGAVTNVDGFVGPSRVEVWNWQNGKRLFVGQDKHKAVLNHVTFHPTDHDWLMAAGGGDSGGILAFWNQKETPATHKAKPKGHIQRFCLDAKQRQLFAVGHGGLQIWSLGAKASG